MGEAARRTHRAGSVATDRPLVSSASGSATTRSQLRCPCTRWHGLMTPPSFVRPLRTLLCLRCDRGCS